MSSKPNHLRALLFAVVAGVAVMAFAVAGCGGDDTSTGTTAAASGAETASTDSGDQSSADAGGADSDSGAGSDDSTTIKPDVQPVEQIGIPKVPNGGDDSIQTFGDQADDQTTAEVVAGLKGYLDARADHDWERACAFLAGDLTEQFAQAQVQEQGGKELDCPGILEALSAGLSKKVLKGAAEVNVGGVRVDDDRAFVIFKGDHDLWYMAPMVQEDGVWKSGALAPSNLP